MNLYDFGVFQYITVISSDNTVLGLTKTKKKKNREILRVSTMWNRKMLQQPKKLFTCSTHTKLN